MDKIQHLKLNVLKCILLPFTDISNVNLKHILEQTKEAITRLKNKVNVSERYQKLQQSASTVFYFPKNNQCTGRLSKTKIPEKPEKAKKMFTERIIFTF